MKTHCVTGALVCILKEEDMRYNLESLIHIYFTLSPLFLYITYILPQS